MSETEILDEIRRIARSELGFERPITPADDLVRDLGLDSLQLIELAVALEDRFRIVLGNPRTVGEVVAMIRGGEEAHP